MSDKLKEYVKKELESGSSQEKVVQTLITAGWKKQQVKLALRQVLEGRENDNEGAEDIEEEMGMRNQEGKIEKLKAELKKSNERVRLFLFVLIVVLMGLIVLGILFSFTSLEPQMIFS